MGTTVVSKQGRVHFEKGIRCMGGTTKYIVTKTCRPFSPSTSLLHMMCRVILHNKVVMMRVNSRVVQSRRQQTLFNECPDTTCIYLHISLHHHLYSIDAERYIHFSPLRKYAFSCNYSCNNICSLYALVYLSVPPLKCKKKVYNNFKAVLCTFLTYHQHPSQALSWKFLT